MLCSLVISLSFSSSWPPDLHCFPDLHSFFALGPRASGPKDYGISVQPLVKFLKVAYCGSFISERRLTSMLTHRMVGKGAQPQKDQSGYPSVIIKARDTVKVLSRRQGVRHRTDLRTDGRVEVEEGPMGWG